MGILSTEQKLSRNYARQQFGLLAYKQIFKRKLTLSVQSLYVEQNCYGVSAFKSIGEQKTMNKKKQKNVDKEGVKRSGKI